MIASFRVYRKISDKTLISGSHLRMKTALGKIRGVPRRSSRSPVLLPIPSTRGQLRGRAAVTGVDAGLLRACISSPGGTCTLPCLAEATAGGDAVSVSWSLGGSVSTTPLLTPSDQEWGFDGYLSTASWPIVTHTLDSKSLKWLKVLLTVRNLSVDSLLSALET